MKRWRENVNRDVERKKEWEWKNWFLGHFGVDVIIMYIIRVHTVATIWPTYTIRIELNSLNYFKILSWVVLS